MADDVELEHAIGFSGAYSRALWLHPDGQHCIYITGACIVVTELQSHTQSFMRGHDDFVTCLALSPSGRLIATGQRGYNSDVIVWDFDGRRILFRLGEHDHEVSVLDFSHDSRLLLSAGNSTDGKLFIWDMFTGYIVASLPQTPRPTLALRFGGFRKDVKGRPIDRYQFCSAGERQVVMWSLNPFTGELENEALKLGPTVRTFTCAAFSPDERYLFLGTTSGDFLVVLVKNMHIIATQPACAQGVSSLFPTTPTQFFVGGGDGSLSLWQLNESRILEVNRIQLRGALKSISGSSAGLLVGSDNGYHFWITLPAMTASTISENHTQPMTHVAFPRGVSDKFATSSEDGTIRIWDGSDYSVISRCSASQAGAPLVFVLTLEVVFSGWQDGRLRTFRADNGQCLWTIDNAHHGGVTAMDLSRNQRFIVTGGEGGEVRVWEVRSKEMVSTLKEHKARVTQLSLLGDDSHAVSVSRDKSMLTWSLRSDKRVSAHTQRIGGIHTLALAGGNRVLTAGQERKLTLWDLNQASPLTSADVQNDEYFTCAVSHNEQFVATGGEQMKLRIWDLASMRVVSECTGHSGPISRVAWSYDDRQVISVGQDNCIFVWNVYLS
mmetsp:Transcript_9656/g.18846  ORF Transcript_9656/g.18846 Transcript_9656/m.18846 type:complete len:608 (-) Transcript_9656:5793-7616(-)